MSDSDELRDVLNNTVEALARSDPNPRTWLTWIAYLLEQLEQKSNSVDPNYQRIYNEMLTALRDTIRNRLQTGGW